MARRASAERILPIRHAAIARSVASLEPSWRMRVSISWRADGVRSPWADGAPALAAEAVGIRAAAPPLAADAGNQVSGPPLEKVASGPE
jgi:hypothetical protein